MKYKGVERFEVKDSNTQTAKLYSCLLHRYMPVYYITVGCEVVLTNAISTQQK